MCEGFNRVCDEGVDVCEGFNRVCDEGVLMCVKGSIVSVTRVCGYV